MFGIGILEIIVIVVAMGLTTLGVLQLVRRR